VGLLRAEDAVGVLSAAVMIIVKAVPRSSNFPESALMQQATAPRKGSWDKKRSGAGSALVDRSQRGKLIEPCLEKSVVLHTGLGALWKRVKKEKKKTGKSPS